MYTEKAVTYVSVNLTECESSIGNPQGIVFYFGLYHLFQLHNTCMWHARLSPWNDFCKHLKINLKGLFGLVCSDWQHCYRPLGEICSISGEVKGKVYISASVSGHPGPAPSLAKDFLGILGPVDSSLVGCRSWCSFSPNLIWLVCLGCKLSRARIVSCVSTSPSTMEPHWRLASLGRMVVQILMIKQRCLGLTPDSL